MRRLMLLAACTLALAACGSDKKSNDTLAPLTSTSVPATAVGGAPLINVTAADYSFTGLPATVKAGTVLTMTNASTKEFHEMVVIRIPDTEKRTVAQLVALPSAESDAIFEGIDPAIVALAKPGEHAQVVFGAGVVIEPGRYAVVCFIPVGADPEKVAEAMADPNAEGPPNLGDGPPHVTKGMYAEVAVT